MTGTPQDLDQDVTAQAAAARTVGDLAQLLRRLRQREARLRRGPRLTYQEIAERTGLSLASVCGYLTGARLAPTDRFDVLAHALGAHSHELGPLATARDRVAEGKRPDGRADPVVVPRMLPAPVAGFAGRDAQLRDLDALRIASGTADPVVISAVAGMAGVGKTALAVHWANRVAEDYPDGQLYVNLNGFGPGEPRSTVDALATLLSGLGVHPSAVPADEAGRVALYRTLAAGRRILVLIDNTDSAERVRPLLPPPPCLALVTSRGDLAGLIAVDGAHRITLDVMSTPEATALLRQLIGPRADREPDAVRALAERCGHLPLALRIAAEQAGFRPTVPISTLVEELDTEPTWLNLSDGTGSLDERIDLRAVFGWSLTRLPDAAVRAFRLLGVDAAARALVREHPDIAIRGVLETGAFDAYSLAALLAVEPAPARQLVTVLARAHLIQPVGRDRYVMHDLLRDYACALAAREVVDEDRHEAINRVLDYYLSTATAAAARQFPGHPQAPPSPARATTSPRFDTVDAAARWLTDNRENLVRACVLAARYGLEAHAIAFAAALRPFLDNGHPQDALVVQAEALAAAERLGVDTAAIHAALGVTHCRLGALDAGAEHLERAVVRYDPVRQPGGAVAVHAALGELHATQGRFADALDCHRRGLRIARAAGLPRPEAAQLVHLAGIELRLGNITAAERAYRHAHTILDGLGDRPALAGAAAGIAMVLARRGRHDDALFHAEQALVINEEFGLIAATVRTLDTVGSVYRDLGRHRDAVEVLGEALRLGRGSNDRAGTARVLNSLGETHEAEGHYPESVDHHRQALAVAERAGDRPECARALAGLAAAHAGLGDAGQAHGFRVAATAAYAEMDVPTTGQTPDPNHR